MKVEVLIDGECVFKSTGVDYYNISRELKLTEDRQWRTFKVTVEIDTESIPKEEVKAVD